MKFGTFNNYQESKKKKTDTDHNFGVVPLWWRQSETDLCRQNYGKAYIMVLRRICS